MKKNAKKKLDFAQIITPEEVYLAARQTEFIQRSGGKIDPFDFLMVLVFRMATSVPGALRLIISLLNVKVSRSGVHQKFTKKASDFFMRCLQLIISKRIITDQILSTEVLDKFNHILIFDSSSWDVSPQLKNIFAGSSGSASDANCKLQCCYDYKEGYFILLEDTAGSQPDQKFSRKISNVVNNGDLVIMDLGYWAFNTLYDINSRDGYFVSRFNTSVNIYQFIGGKLVKIDLVKLLSEEKRRKSVEIEVYIRGQKGELLKIRLIAFRAPEDVANSRRNKMKKNAKKKGRTPTEKSLYLCDWSIFCTNAPEELVPSDMIRTIYRIRWNIELIFKDWKSILRMHVSNVRKNHHRVKCELYAKLIFAVIVHIIHNTIHQYVWLKERKEISFDCVWKFIISRAESLHKAIKSSINQFSAEVNNLVPMMIITCEKYHQPSRKTTLQLVDEMIGDAIPVKLNIENLRCYMI